MIIFKNSLLWLGLVIVLISCNTKKNAEKKDAGWIKKYQSTITLGPDSAEIENFLLSIKPERERLIAEIKRTNSALYNEYLQEGKRFKDTLSKTQLEQSVALLNKKYGNAFKAAFEKAGVAASLKQKQEAWVAAHRREGEEWDESDGDCGNVAWTIRMRKPIHGGTDDGGKEEPHRKPPGGSGERSDSSFTVGCPFGIRSFSRGCTGTATINPLTGFGTCNVLAAFSSMFSGGCQANATLGTDLSIPAKFIHVTSTFNCDFQLIAFAGAFGGYSFCEVSAGSQIVETGRTVVFREQAKILAISYGLLAMMSFVDAKNETFIVSYDKANSIVTATPSMKCIANGNSFLGYTFPSGNVTTINSLFMDLHR